MFLKENNCEDSSQSISIKLVIKTEEWCNGDHGERAGSPQQTHTDTASGQKTEPCSWGKDELSSKIH